MSRLPTRVVRAGIAMLGTVAVIAPAIAQDAPREAASALEEIIVTAQKREESAQSVPIAVTALDAAQIEKSYARDIQDVENLAPNLIIDPTLGNGTASISIRGLQLNDVEKSFDPAVAVYLDGIYLANTTGALLQMYDAEAVEVLRGPQGTLFGRNTIGGLINIRRTQPTGEFGGKFAVNFGRYNQLDARAVLNFGAIADGKLATKLSLVRQDGGGYFQNLSRDKREGDTAFTGITLTSLWTPSDSFEATLTLDLFDDKTPTRPVTSLTQAGETFFGFGVTGAPRTDIAYHRNTLTTLDQKAFVKSKAVTLNAAWQLSDAHRLVSVTGWRDVKDDAVQEFDGVAANIFWTQRPQKSDQLSEELRLESDWNDSVRSTLGLYYFDGAYELNQSTHIFGGLAARPYFRQETTSTALFGQVDWSITDAITLSLGGRYNDEEKEACGINQNPANAAGPALLSFGSCGIAGRAAENLVNTYVDITTGLTRTATGKESWSKFTPRVNVSWQLDDSKLAYLTYSEGFRSGGFNGRAADAGTLGPYQPESVESFELGFKSQWLDNRFRMNLTAFSTDYLDKQEDVVFPDPALGTVTLVQNAASASIKGAEIELLAIPTDGLTLGLNIGLLDASYDEWLVPGIPLTPMGPAGIVDKSDFKLRRAPEYTAAFNVQYEQALGNGSFLVYGLNYSYKDDYYVIANTVQRPAALDSGLVDAFGLLDASISYETESWSVSLWGKNLTDEDYFTHVLDAGTNYGSGPNNAPVPIAGLWTFGTINPPRTYGVEFRFKF
jgi:iron complex outermembrane receptor protein